MVMRKTRGISVAHDRKRDVRTSLQPNAMVDIDHFKQVNDTFGHPVGDEVLAEVARRLSSVARSGDLVGRWGGEEFFAILPFEGIWSTTGLRLTTSRKSHVVERA
jgi:diguanylate cyclase (GGDEF)-like protein